MAPQSNMNELAIRVESVETRLEDHLRSTEWQVERSIESRDRIVRLETVMVNEDTKIDHKVDLLMQRFDQHLSQEKALLEELKKTNEKIDGMEGQINDLNGKVDKFIYMGIGVAATVAVVWGIITFVVPLIKT